MEAPSWGTPIGIILFPTSQNLDPARLQRIVPEMSSEIYLVPLHEAINRQKLIGVGQGAGKKAAAAIDASFHK